MVTYLAEIPFVRLRTGLPKHLLNGNAGFSESIALAQSFDSAPQLTVDLKAKCFYANSMRIKMTSLNFAFYLWMIEQTITRNQPLQRPHYVEANTIYAENFLKLYNSISTEGEREKVIFGFETDGGMTGKWISERITAVAKSFQHVLEHSAANFYCIQTQGKNSNRSYFVPLKTSQITHVK